MLLGVVDAVIPSEVITRRRKAWIARKREEKKTPVEGSQEMKRRDWDTVDDYLRLEREHYRRQRINELSSEKV